MWIAWMEFDLLLGDMHSLKENRSILRPLGAGLSTRRGLHSSEDE